MVSKSSHLVLVSGSIQRKNLSLIRSLGKAGHSVEVISSNRFSPGIQSRFCKKMISHNPEYDYIETIRNLDFNVEKPIYIPMEENDVLQLAINQKELELKFQFLVAPLKSIEIAIDKYKTIDFARKMNIPTPETFQSDNFEKFWSLVSLKVSSRTIQNFIAKPVRGSGSVGIIYFEKSSKEQLTYPSLRKHWDKFGPLIIQQRIPHEGKAVGVSLLFGNKSEIIADFTHLRLHSYPITGGPSTDRKCVDMPLVTEMSKELLRALNWRGVAMVEWKIDPVTGTPMLLEINPRFWGSLELAIRSGVDFPRLTVDVITAKPINYSTKPKLDTRCRWVFPGEILRYISSPKKDRESIGNFINGLIRESEEFDKADLRGSFFAIVYPLSFLFRRKYLKLLQR
jgi:predicted ATP-grasp superfamily ATP-dependent carboligase